jgi:hypothetical protein
VPKVLTIAIDEDTAVATHVLRIPATKVGVEEGMWDAPQRLHRCLKPISADIKLDTSFLLFLVCLHRLDLPR